VRESHKIGAGSSQGTRYRWAPTEFRQARTGSAVPGSLTETALDRVGSLSLEAPSGGFDSRRRHPEKPSNLNGLLGFSLPSFSSCDLSVPLWRL